MSGSARWHYYNGRREKRLAALNALNWKCPRCKQFKRNCRSTEWVCVDAKRYICRSCHVSEGDPRGVSTPRWKWSRTVRYCQPGSIRVWRRQHKLTNQQVAAMCGKSRRHVYRAEREGGMIDLPCAVSLKKYVALNLRECCRNRGLGPIGVASLLNVGRSSANRILSGEQEVGADLVVLLYECLSRSARKEPESESELSAAFKAWCETSNRDAQSDESFADFLEEVV